MIDSYYRSRFQSLCIDPVVNYLDTYRLHPMLCTGAALLLGVSTLPLLAFGYSELAAVLLCVSGYLDVLDGSLARKQGMASPLGALVDIVSDRIVEASVIIGLFLYAPESRSLLALGMMASVLVCVTSFLVVGIFAENRGQKSFHYSPGLMERSEAFIFFSSMILLPSYFNYISLLFIVLVIWTAVVRVLEFAQIRVVNEFFLESSVSEEE